MKERQHVTFFSSGVRFQQRSFFSAPVIGMFCFHVLKMFSCQLCRRRAQKFARFKMKKMLLRARAVHAVYACCFPDWSCRLIAGLIIARS